MKFKNTQINDIENTVYKVYRMQQKQFLEGSSYRRFSKKKKEISEIT